MSDRSPRVNPTRDIRARALAAVVTAAAAGLTGAAGACDGLVDFSSQPIGAAWGGAIGTPPGVTQFVEGGVGVAFGPTAGGAYGEANIVPATPVFGTAQTMQVGNITVGFDILGVPCVEQVRFRFADYGGTENLTVNGAPTYVGELAAAPAAIAPGVVCSVSTSPIPGGGGITGVVTLTGSVDSVRVAGQELLLDDFCVTACAAGPADCDQLMDFESRVVGESFGGPVGTPIGVVQFIEDGLTARFTPTAWGAYGLAIVDPAFPFFGTGNILQLSNIALGVDTSLVGCATAVTFQYLDLGGMEELQVNGAPPFVGEIGATPVAIAPGVTATVSSVAVAGGTTGAVRLEGSISRVRVAGQEFWVDDICVELSDCVADVDCDGIVGFTDLLAILAGFGPCPGPLVGCRIDVSGDGVVDFDDILAVLAAWGPC